MSMMPSTVSRAARWIRALPVRGSGRFCPVCEAEAKVFLSFGSPPRPEAQCWRCHSLERQRFLWHFLMTRCLPNYSDDVTFLHIAPEACLAAGLRRRYPKGYVSADLLRDDVDVTLDITNSHFPDAEFDLICCSHVLEHVDDDRAAIREIYRMLKPGGTALLMVPITEDVTYEDPSVTSPEEREAKFGQSDHVRAYGRDFVERVAAVAGEHLSVVSPQDILDRAALLRMGINELAGEIYVMRKPQAGD
ncbi:MAG: class I SAM-dependent methyltransferase [Woeseiaceae bacterium]